MFHWTDYLTIAKNLASSDDEAAWRTSISRSYYFALHIAEEACTAARVLIPREVLRGRIIDRSHHARVIAALIRHGDPHLQKAGALLNYMRAWRNTADYEGVFNGNGAAIAEEAIGYAQRIQKELAWFGRERDGP